MMRDNNNETNMKTPGKITLDQIGRYLDDLRAITYGQMRAKGDLNKTKSVSDVLQSTKDVPIQRA